MCMCIDEMKAAAGNTTTGNANKKREAVMDRGEQMKATASYIPKVRGYIVQLSCFDIFSS